jgi:hypothetical protein
MARHALLLALAAGLLVLSPALAATPDYAEGCVRAPAPLRASTRAARSRACSRSARAALALRRARFETAGPGVTRAVALRMLTRQGCDAPLCLCAASALSHPSRQQLRHHRRQEVRRLRWRHRRAGH